MPTGLSLVNYMQSTPSIGEHAVGDIQLEVNETAAGTFRTMEMAFVYGVVTLALDGPDAHDGPPREQGPREWVAGLLSQAGYDVVMMDGRKNGELHEWLETGRPGRLPELIVDISAPDRPHETVLCKGSRGGMRYSCSQEKVQDLS